MFMETLLGKIDRLKSEYDGLKPLADDRQRELDKKYQLERYPKNNAL